MSDKGGLPPCHCTVCRPDDTIKKHQRCQSPLASAPSASLNSPRGLYFLKPDTDRTLILTFQRRWLRVLWVINVFKVSCWSRTFLLQVFHEKDPTLYKLLKSSRCGLTVALRICISMLPTRLHFWSCVCLFVIKHLLDFGESQWEDERWAKEELIIFWWNVLMVQIQEV